MDSTTILVIIILVIIFGGGGWMAEAAGSEGPATIHECPFANIRDARKSRKTGVIWRAIG